MRAGCLGRQLDREERGRRVEQGVGEGDCWMREEGERKEEGKRRGGKRGREGKRRGRGREHRKGEKEKRRDIE